MNIGIIFTNVGPYHLERANAASLALAKLGHTLTLIELTADTMDHPWSVARTREQFNWITLSNSNNARQHLLVLGGRLYRLLQKIDFDVIAIPGYYNVVFLLALCWAKQKKRSAILLSETNADDSVRHWFQEKVKQKIINKFDAALVGGKSHVRYLKMLGMPEERIFVGYDVVGLHNFDPKLLSHLPSPLPEKFFLAVNRFISKKNLSFLIDAYAAYRRFAGSKSWDLVICGDGELKCALMQQIKEQEVDKYVHLPGFLDQRQLLPYFAHAACFVHASVVEQWGLVVNEAMAAGLPVLVSKRCGCYEDLVLEGVNGWGFDPTDQQQLQALMTAVTCGSIDLAAMGQASLEHIQHFDPSFFGEGLVKAINCALDKRANK